MAWSVEVAESARKELKRLDPARRTRMVRFLRERIAATEDPRALGKALSGEFKGLWRYRVGDMRIIAEMQHGRCVVLVLRVGNRREIYRHSLR